MKIGISLLTASNMKVGPDNVSLNLIHNIVRIDKRNEYVIYINDECRNWLSIYQNSAELVCVKHPIRKAPWLFEQLFFNFDWRARGLDLLHFPQSQGVIGYRGKYVLTIHDLRAYLRPDLVKYSHYLRSKVLLKNNVLKADRIITVSKYVRDQILSNFPIPENNIRVVYNGVDKRFGGLPQPEDFLTRYGLPGKYILFVGETHPNKNLLRTIKAFKIAKEKHQLDCHFVIAGSPGTDDDNLKNYVKANGLEGFVHFIGYFPDQDLPYLYSSACLFVYVSLDEGFGIPPLEAMSCGIPVIASNTSCIPEILGDAAVLVDPLSVDSIAGGMEKLLTNCGYYDKQVQKGRDRVKLFSWENMAKEVVEVYNEIGCNITK